MFTLWFKARGSESLPPGLQTTHAGVVFHLRPADAPLLHPDGVRSTESGMALEMTPQGPPPTGHQTIHEGLSYLLQGQPQSLASGGIHAQWRVAGREVVVVAAALPDRSFHPLGQTERRRSEARTLNREIRRILGGPVGTPPVTLVVASIHDHPESAAWREFSEGLGPAIRPVELAGKDGSRWTRHAEGVDTYERLDGLWVGTAGTGMWIEADLVDDPDAPGTRWIRARLFDASVDR